MAKKVEGYIKLQIPAGKATPAPPVGPALGQHGINIAQFTKEFNAKTQGQDGMIIPVVITVYADRSFSFVTKTPPAAVLLKKACRQLRSSYEHDCWYSKKYGYHSRRVVKIYRRKKELMSFGRCGRQCSLIPLGGLKNEKR